MTIESDGVKFATTVWRIKRDTAKSKDNTSK